MYEGGTITRKVSQGGTSPWCPHIPTPMERERVGESEREMGRKSEREKKEERKRNIDGEKE